MQIRFLFIATFLFFISNNFAQSFDDIKNADQYIWGEGISTDKSKADNQALNDLIGKISIQVESSFENVAIEEGGNFKEYTHGVIKTYSVATLNGAKQLVSFKKGKWSILRYLTNTGLDELFLEREEKIKDYTKLGIQAEKEYRMGDALKYYYWAYALLLTNPRHDKIEMELDKGEIVQLDRQLNDKIGNIFTNLDFQINSIEKYDEEEKNTILLTIKHKNAPVECLDFNYYDGHSFSDLRGAKNGVGTIDLFGESRKALRKIQLSIEFKYINKSQHDKELNAALETVFIPNFANSSIEIRLPNKQQTKQYVVENKPEPQFQSVNTKEKSVKDHRKMISRILESIGDKDYNRYIEYFNPEGLDMYNKLIKYGNVQLLPIHDTLKVVKIGEEVIVRSAPMSFYFPNSKRRFVENVVFTFDSLQKIEAVSFALSDVSIRDILDHSDNFGSVADKYQLIKFMEFYKTAYSLERLDYIESIFSEDALIIVGTVLKRKPKPIDGMYEQLGSNNVKYQRFTKKEYIERLANVFKSKEFINIDFDETKIKKVNGNDKIYGIQLAQHYYSSNYADFGYLFLMINLNDTLKPTIYVRTWQPEKNEDGSIFGLDNFSFN